MAIRFRFYVLEENGSLKRIPRRVADRLPFGEDTIPEYAGTTQKVVQVVVEYKDGKPACILDTIGSYWEFDETGSIVESLQRSIRDVLDADARTTNKTGKVVDLRPELERKKLLEKHRFDVDHDALQRIIVDLWPNSDIASEIRTVQGKAPKKPSLTWEAKEAMEKLHSAVGSISIALQDLSEPALKGIVHEANRLALGYSDDREVWKAIAQEADKHREIRARHRTGKGKFYAILHVWRQVDRHEMRDVDTITVACKGKAAALEAARRLLSENVHRFDYDISIEAEVLTDLEFGDMSDEDIAS